MFENKKLNEEIKLNWKGIVFVEQTRHIPTIAEYEVGLAVTEISNAILNDLDVESVISREHNRIVDKYELNESDSNKILDMIKDAVSE